MPQQTPYIGRKISLISKLDIRYDGILYTVDTDESTIALAKVRSFGTEDRPTTNPVPARNDVYDYIIFKASDIEDLIVCDTPEPQLNSGALAYDPAILTISSNSHVLPPPPPNVLPLTNATRLSAGSSRSDSPNQTSGVGGNEAARGEQPHATSRAPGARRITVPQTGYRGIGVGQHGSFAPPPPQRGAAAAQRMNTEGGGYHPRGFIPGSFPRARGNKTNPKKRFKFDTDYDFEKANEQFQDTLNNIIQHLKKTKLDEGSEKESTGSEAVPKVIEEGEVLDNEEDDSADNYYDKSSSFFDGISCQTLEKQQGKPPSTDWRKERETNQQTFGYSAVRSLAFRRGRGFQGGRSMRGDNRMYRYNNGYNNYNGPRGGYNYYGYARHGSYRPFVRPFVQ